MPSLKCMREHLATVGVALLTLVSATWLVAAESGSDKSEFKKQIGTVGAIQGVALAVDAYREENKMNPSTLDALVPLYIRERRWLSDAWGRRVHYYATKASYILISYGRNGTPDDQLADVGGFGPADDFDQDIVLIDGEWAQSPPNVDR